MKVAVFINSSAGSMLGQSQETAFRRALDCFASFHFPASIRFGPSDLIPMLAREAVKDGLDLIVAGGGDGTISSVAEVATANGIPLGVIPLGTHNHFAKDLKIPLDFSQAVQTLAQGEPKAIDVGEINSHIFINNASIGAYPRIVEERGELIQRGQKRKSLAMLAATWKVFARAPLLFVTLELDGERHFHATPFVFVGNNRYQGNLFSSRFRPSLQEGKLCVFVARCTGIGCLTRLAVSAMLNRLERSPDFEILVGEKLRVYMRRRMIRTSKDGEVLRMPTPLTFSIRKRGLQVIVPKEKP